MLNILDDYPNATDDQKKRLLAAQDEWGRRIKERGDPPATKWPDGNRKDYYGDINDDFEREINEIMEIIKPGAA